MIIGPDDPRAITDPAELKRLRAYTDAWNEEWLGLKPPTAKERADKAKREAAILDLIGWEDPA
jgi:hypothetical protein